MVELMVDEKRGRLRKTPLFIICLITAIIFISSIGLMVKNSNDLTEITEESVKSKLISISMAAMQILDIEAFDGYNSLDDVAADQEDYDEVLSRLSALALAVEAEYIYALKPIGNEYMFVFDTDPEDGTIFIPYELNPVHEDAFAGNRSVDVVNVQDIYGSFSTCAVPIYREGQVIGILCVDVEDDFLATSRTAATRNLVFLGSFLLLLLTAMLLFLGYLLRRIAKIQERLRHISENDPVTGLPNRAYLFSYLDSHMMLKKEMPFALVFVDLDNFKMVNDSAGHDAGDEVLRRVGDYLKSQGLDGETFHPTSGALNVSARVGGDEFIQIYPGIATIEDADRIAAKILNEFDPAAISRHAEKYHVGMSIGVALYPYHSENYHVLIKYADAAMYEAKHGGKGRYCVYTDGLAEKEWKAKGRE